MLIIRRLSLILVFFDLTLWVFMILFCNLLQFWRSILKSEKTLRKVIPLIANFFDLGSIVKIENAPESANANFFVRTSKGHYFVKINLEPHTLANKFSEETYIKHLISYGIPVTPYLLGQNGSPIFEDGKVMAMVQNIVPGSNPKITISSVAQIGQFLGRLSLVPFTKLPHRYGWLSPEYIKENLVKLDGNFRGNSKVHKILSVYDSCKDFEKNTLPRLPKSIIHGDGHSENVIFQDKQLATFVDWEDSTVAPSLLDFVSSAAYWCFEDGIIRPKLYRTFYKSYTDERPLTELESNHLEDCMKYVGVIQTMWRFLNCGGRGRYDALWGLKLCDWKAPVFTG